MGAAVKPFEICRPGTFVDANGRPVTVTESDLREMAMGYNPKLRRAPLVIGHPKSIDPAYGWVREMDYKDGALFAVPEQVEETFAGAVKDGRFPNRSAAFFLPNTPGNPTPGKHYLHHVGFLGASHPAVDGLKPVEFSAFEAGAEMIVSLSGWEEHIRHSARLTFQREQEAKQLADDLVNKGILRPTEREGFVALAGALVDSHQVIQFGAGDEKQRVDAFDLLRRIMEGRQPMVTFGELAPDGGPIPGVALSMPEGMAVDNSRADLHARAMAYQHANKCDYRTAVLAVSARGRT